MGKTRIVYSECSEDIINELDRLLKETLVDSAEVAVQETKKRIKKYTGQLADGIVSDEKASISNELNTITFGYLTQSSFKKNVRTGTYYPNPHWIEFGTNSHTIQTKQLRYGDEKLTYQLKGLDGTTYGYSVEHPNMPAKNYLRDSCKDKSKEMQNILISGIKKIEDFEKANMKEIVYEVI